MSDLTPERVAEGRALLEKMTPGPLAVDAVNSEHLHDIIMDYKIPHAGYPILVATVFYDDNGGPGDIAPSEAEANAKGIVWLVNHADALFAAVGERDAAEAQNAKMREALEWYATKMNWSMNNTDCGEKARAALADCPAPPTTGADR